MNPDTPTGQPPAVDALHHVAIQADNIERALEWYTARFNVEIVYHDASWAMLRFSNIYLALVTPGQHPPHIAIEHEHAERFGELRPHRDGTASVYIRDSEDNTLELLKKNVNDRPAQTSVSAYEDPLEK